MAQQNVATTTTAVGASGAISAALATVLIKLDIKFQWEFGPEFWGAMIILIFALPAFIVAAVRWWLRLKQAVQEETEHEENNSGA